MKKIMLLFTLFVVAIAASAQRPEDFTGSLLWKISGNGLEKPSYVFGTYHLLGAELLETVPGLKQAVEETMQTVGELTLEEMAASQLKAMPYMMMPQEEGYKDILTEEEYDHLDALLKKTMGAGLDQFGMLTPSMISVSMIYVIYMKEKPDFNPLAFEGIDGYLLRMASENGKEVLGLETADEQIKLLFGSDEPMKAQIDALVCSLENFDSFSTQHTQLEKDYIAGELYKMYADSFLNPDYPCADFITEEHKHSILKNRNDNWMEKLPAIISTKPTLIVVGALHLAAEEGILWQLYQSGYTVEKVK